MGVAPRLFLVFDVISVWDTSWRYVQTGAVFSAIRPVVATFRVVP